MNTKVEPSHEVFAPAKINLSLRVLGRRDDGFHEIETRMVPVAGVCDTIQLELLPSMAKGMVELVCEVPGVPTDDTNLAVAAVRAMESACDRKFSGMRITLEKNIPSGAGLGGGSSDAAAVLSAVNELEALGLSRDRLADIAADIGSDVPFFIYDRACDCTGRGEVVTPLAAGQLMELPRLLLAKPPFAVETPGAYKRWKDSREIPGVLYAPQETQMGMLVNDLERPVFEKFPFLAELKMWFLAREEVTASLMSGSGATVFALLRVGSNEEALVAELKQRFGADMWTVVPADPVAIS